MLVKIIPARSRPGGAQGFGQCVTYVCSKAAAVKLRYLLGDWTDTPTQMALSAGLNPRLSHPCMHLIISWSPDERPSVDEVFKAADRVLTELGASDHQAVIAIHTDRAHRHAHIVLNLVHPLTGKTLNRCHDYARLERACRLIEREMGWRADPGRFDAALQDNMLVLRPKPSEHWQRKTHAREKGGCVESAATRGQARRLGFRPLDQRYSASQLNIIRASLDAAPDWPTVHEVMAGAGWRYLPCGSAGARIVSRLDPHSAIPAKRLGARFSLPRMVARLGRYLPVTIAPMGKRALALRRRLTALSQAGATPLVPAPDPEILALLWHARAERQAAKVARQQAANLLAQQHRLEVATVRSLLRSRRNGVTTLLRKLLREEQRAERVALRAKWAALPPTLEARDLLAVTVATAVTPPREHGPLDVRPPAQEDHAPLKEIPLAFDVSVAPTSDSAAVTDVDVDAHIEADTDADPGPSP